MDGSDHSNGIAFANSARSYIRTDRDLLRFSAAIDRFLEVAGDHGLDVNEVETLSSAGIHSAALLELMAQQPVASGEGTKK